MTTPALGDLPDWQQLSAPNIFTVAQVNIASGQNLQMIGIPNPIRLWGVWLNVSLGTAAAYAAAPNQWGAQIQDNSGFVYIRVECFISAPSHEAVSSMFIDLHGVQVAAPGGNARLNLITDAALLNATTRVNAGIIASNP